ncbi:MULTISPECIES: penicillin-binding transpeptidase domain-containing protein [unclassified Corynebacterium]|uniref:penicillin-binding transpeptidase domain-containing protein n=1 Tax=unclassified Corynebacterium TaxID=2624378 RepID=UPI0021686691|nr:MULTISPECIES: penicillin-binding transpeptidase domain-containing protein [unclassified Corynebacterium]MCS4489104.1 penicillin-binding transpeptidase domain-containing protein [Corynebacterium sp. ES2775-CONJ]MCS4490917.1 penicillin-binding transpeptidase domain-containing protein [Corynebacterium sp. ES2715-CONJ3]
MIRALLRSPQALVCAVFLIASLTACTPKPAAVKPIAQEFLSHFIDQDFAAAAALTDIPKDAENVLAETFQGLQADALEATITKVEARETLATVYYQLTWIIPRERTLEYESSLVLNKFNDQWVIRWQPSIIHPRLGANQHLELRAINAQRASIISSDGAAVLVPGVVDRILVDLDQVGDRRAMARAIAAAFAEIHRTDPNALLIDEATLAANLQEASGVYSVTTARKEISAQIKAILGGKPGIIFHEEAAMVSTDPGFAPEIVSRVAHLVNDRLDGVNGWRIVVVTHDGAVIDTIEHHEPDTAPAIEISLDHLVQRAAEEAVAMRSEQQAIILALRPTTGEILAVAQTKEADKQGALGLTGLFPPGSTFKIITAAAGIEQGGLHPDTVVPCPGSMNIYGRIVNNYNGFSLGNVPLETAFARSCNTTFAQISTDLHAGELQAVAKEFGLGVDYEIPGLATVTGSVPTGEKPLERTESGYGQGEVLVSPFGLALASSTAATGKTPLPWLISGFDTKVTGKKKDPDPATIEQLRALMGAVTEPGGTAAGMRAGGKIFAKTGEAEINSGSHSWFTGYRDDIAFATLIVLGGGSESAVAMTDRFFSRLDELREGGQ